MMRFDESADYTIGFPIVWDKGKVIRVGTCEDEHLCRLVADASKFCDISGTPSYMLFVSGYVVYSVDEGYRRDDNGDGCPPSTELEDILVTQVEIDETFPLPYDVKAWDILTGLMWDNQDDIEL